MAFQSTHPCGVRRRKRVFAIVDFGFNPRTRVGCELVVNEADVYDTGFNPRTRVGCEASHINNVMLNTSFNPRTRVGCEGAF